MAVAPPGSEVEICNLALSRLGQKFINDIEAPSNFLEDLCARHYPMTRRRLLRGPRVYNFAKKYLQVTKSGSEVPAYGFAQAYQLPNDFLRLLALGEHVINNDTPPGLYDIVNGFIYTDRTIKADTINLYYIFDETRVAKWDAIFVNLARLELAKDMAYAFTLKQSLIKGLDQELRDVRLEAGAVSGQEKPPRRIQRSRWRDSRIEGNRLRDTTRHPI